MGGCFSSESGQKEVLPQKGCTDIFWLIVFVLFSLGLIIIAGFAFIYGNPLRLVNGYDSFGNTCGVKSNTKYDNFPLSGQDMSDRKYLYFFDLLHIQESLKICVKRCPKRNMNTSLDLYEYFRETGYSYCRYDFNIDLLKVGDRDYFDRLGPCPDLPITYERSVLHRCVPSDKNAPLTKIRKAYDLLNSWDTYREILRDFYASWYIILGVCASAALFSIIIIAMLHCVTQIVSWLICITVGLASIVITFVLWKAYYDAKVTANNAVQQGGYLDNLLKNQTAILVMAIIATVVMVSIIILIIVIKDKLKGLAALFEEAGKCMLQLPGLVLPPIFAFTALSLFLIFWVWVMVCLSTANYPFQKPIIASDELNITRNDQNAAHNDPNYKSLLNVEFVNVKWLNNMTYYYLIGLIWISEFIFACQQMAIAGAVVFWYFKKPYDSPVFTASSKLIAHHLGSVAKGSLLITIFKIPRLILMYFYTKMKRNQATSGCAECGMKCCICCFYVLEKFIRYLNHNAYTVIAIESLNFCPAAGVAWKAMVSNALSVATINGVGDFILFLGKLAVATICGIIAIFLLKGKEDVNIYIVVVVFISVVSFFIAHIILSLYEMVVDTLFLCVCEDRNINGNSGRWKDSNLAHLIGEAPVSRDTADSVEAPMQAVELSQVHREPFHYENTDAPVITREPFKQLA